MKLDLLLSRLEGVKQTGKDRWIAKCPAHNDRTPSMGVRCVDDRILMHCFTGCSVNEIVSAVGMEITDLFPDSRETHKPLRQRFMPQDVIQCLSGETLFLLMCARDMAKGEVLPEKDIKKLEVCHRRFANAAKAAGI